MMGAHIVRVHGVREMVDVVRVVDQVCSHRNSFCDNDSSLSEEATL
jgi:dihydropteroate synthase